MDYAGTVHGNGSNNTLFNKFNDDRCQADLYGMCSHTEHNGPASLFRFNYRRDYFSQITGSEDIGKTFQKFLERSSGKGFAELVTGKFTLPSLQFAGFYVVKVYGYIFFGHRENIPFMLWIGQGGVCCFKGFTFDILL